jgi:hypothetical protein
MPNLEEHCKHSKDRYGVEGRDIHSWMDEPSIKFTGSHRQYRHDKEGLESVKDTFGEKYGRSVAGNIAMDHIDLDKKESNKKLEEKNDGILAEKEPKNSEYKEKKEKDRREQRTLEIKTSGIRNYIQAKYAPLKIKQSLFDLALTSLMDWEKYCLSQKTPNTNAEKKDMTNYIIDLRKRVEARTAAHYLGFLVAYLKHEKLDDLALYANEKKKEFAEEYRKADKKAKSMPIKDVVTLYKSAPLRGKILIRLLLLQTDIPIESLGKISFIQISKGKYQFNIDGNIRDINEETIKLAEPLIKENTEKGDKRLLTIGARTFEENIHDYAERANLSYRITPKDLRKFGKIINQIMNQDDFIGKLEE